MLIHKNPHPHRQPHLALLANDDRPDECKICVSRPTEGLAPATKSCATGCIARRSKRRVSDPYAVTFGRILSAEERQELLDILGAIQNPDGRHRHECHEAADSSEAQGQSAKDKSKVRQRKRAPRRSQMVIFASKAVELYVMVVSKC